MEQDDLMPVDEFCNYYHAEFSFVNSLQEHGLIEITTIDNTTYVHKSQLTELEKFTRFYYEMEINLEGIEAITHLLHRINDMQMDIARMKNKMQWYGEEEL